MEGGFQNKNNKIWNITPIANYFSEVENKQATAAE